LGAELVSVGEAFVELGNLVTQNPCFFFQDFLGLFGSLTGQLRATEFIRLGNGARIKLTNLLISFCEGPFELLDRAAMDGFPITQLDLQLMHTVSGRLQLLHLGAEPLSLGEAFVELGDLVTQDADFFLLNLAGLLGSPTGL